MSDRLHLSTLGVDFTISSGFGLTSANRSIGRAMRTFPDLILRAWGRHLTRRSCRAASLYLSSLDDGALAGIGLRRAEIPSAVRQLEVTLLNRSRSASHGAIQ